MRMLTGTLLCSLLGCGPSAGPAPTPDPAAGHRQAVSRVIQANRAWREEDFRQAVDAGRDPEAVAFFRRQRDHFAGLGRNGLPADMAAAYDRVARASGDQLRVAEAHVERLKSPRDWHAAERDGQQPGSGPVPSAVARTGRERRDAEAALEDAVKRYDPASGQ